MRTFVVLLIACVLVVGIAHAQQTPMSSDALKKQAAQQIGSVVARFPEKFRKQAENVLVSRLAFIAPNCAAYGNYRFAFSRMAGEETEACLLNTYKSFVFELNNYNSGPHSDTLSVLGACQGNGDACFSARLTKIASKFGQGFKNFYTDFSGPEYDYPSTKNAVSDAKAIQKQMLSNMTAECKLEVATRTKGEEKPLYKACLIAKLEAWQGYRYLLTSGE